MDEIFCIGINVEFEGIFWSFNEFQGLSPFSTGFCHSLKGI